MDSCVKGINLVSDWSNEQMNRAYCMLLRERTSYKAIKGAWYRANLVNHDPATSRKGSLGSKKKTCVPNIQLLWRSAMISASLWLRNPKAFLIWNCRVSKCTALREWQNTWSVLGPGHTARAWSADPEVQMLGVTVCPAGPMALRNQISITVLSTSLLDRAYPSDILMLCSVPLKS